MDCSNHFEYYTLIISLCALIIIAVNHISKNRVGLIYLGLIVGIIALYTVVKIYESHSVESEVEDRFELALYGFWFTMCITEINRNNSNRNHNLKMKHDLYFQIMRQIKELDKEFKDFWNYSLYDDKQLRNLVFSLLPIHSQLLHSLQVADKSVFNGLSMRVDVSFAKVFGEIIDLIQKYSRDIRGKSNSSINPIRTNFADKIQELMTQYNENQFLFLDKFADEL